MIVSELLETAMLLCFSASWYWSIREVLLARQIRVMPLMFPVLAVVGCLLGLGSKLVVFSETGMLSHLIWLYAWNVIVTLAQLHLMLLLMSRSDDRESFPGGLDQPAGST